MIALFRLPRQMQRVKRHGRLQIGLLCQSSDLQASVHRPALHFMPNLTEFVKSLVLHLWAPITLRWLLQGSGTTLPVAASTSSFFGAAVLKRLRFKPVLDGDCVQTEGKNGRLRRGIVDVGSGSCCTLARGMCTQASGR